MAKLNKIARYNLILLALSFTYVFLVGFIHDDSIRNIIYNSVFTVIYIVSAMVISKASYTKFHNYALVAIIVMWLSEFLDFEYLGLISSVVSIMFLLTIIFLMVIKIASSKDVTILEFVEAVNVYFLLGIIGSVLFKIIKNFVPGESFNFAGETLQPTTDFIYFSFVTLTTLGYGDISPIDPYAKSLAIFLSIAGQLYLTMIIAVLVGKYLSAKQ